MRLAKSTSRMRSLLNRCGMDQLSSIENERESGGWGAARAVVMTDELMNHICDRRAVKPNMRGDPIVKAVEVRQALLRHLEAKGSSPY